MAHTNPKYQLFHLNRYKWILSNSKGKAKERGVENKRSTRRRSYTYWKPFSTSLGFPSFFFFFFLPLSTWSRRRRRRKLNLEHKGQIKSQGGKSYILSTLSLRRQNSATHRTGTRGDNTTTIRWVYGCVPHFTRYVLLIRGNV